MTQKLQLLVPNHDASTFGCPFLRALTKNYFDLVRYDPAKSYDKSNTLVVANIFQDLPEEQRWYRPLFDQGFKLAIDSLWEPAWNFHRNYRLPAGEYLLITSPNFFWYNECYSNRYFGHIRHTYTDAYTKVGLMPMRLYRPHRNRIYTQLQYHNLLDKFIWSFNAIGKYLPDDAPDTGFHDFQRYLNESWYRDTFFSMVVESRSMFEPSETIPFFTEKTFKPIAHFHPFMIYGHTGTLAHIKKLGFETYENLFDESYDQLTNDEQKLDLVIENIKRTTLEPYDSLTIEKMIHNRNHFYNLDLVNHGFYKDIVEPMFEYAAR